MPRAMRVEDPGAIYHVMDRGDRQEDIFADGVDRQDFLQDSGRGLPPDGMAADQVDCGADAHWHDQRREDRAAAGDIPNWRSI